MEDLPIEKKPKLLQAVELVLADPNNIKRESLQIVEKYRKKRPSASDSEIRDLAYKKIISKYSYYSAFIGGTSALPGVVPGIGTAVAMAGGASADAVASMKFQIEMTMAIATVYDYDILIEEQKRVCFIVAGLGALNEVGKEGGKAIGSKTFIALTRRYLKGATLQAVKAIFRKLGVTFTRKALEKSIPFGVGVVVGFSANKGLTLYVGAKARDFFEADC